ncbi:MAG: hypothetical protein NTU83_11395 [Candidatus Hydrogenedentes bacterium]|nr:hypothetical protein [Candidatus Hydrogenedentota bacterium]
MSGWLASAEYGARRSLYSRVAGVFLFVPFLVQAGLDAMAGQARMAGTKMIPAFSYVLSLLALKLLGKERKSHISDWNSDEALRWLAGLNMLPKTTAANPVSAQARRDQHALPIPWLHGKRFRFEFK